MIFSTLGRYFFRRYVITAFWFMLGVSAIIFLADFSESTRRLSGLAQYSIFGALGMTALRLPSILQQMALLPPLNQGREVPMVAVGALKMETRA